jgi:hypothetical protein
MKTGLVVLVADTVVCEARAGKLVVHAADPVGKRSQG